MTTPLRQPRRLSRDTISSASRRRDNSQTGIPMAASSRSAANRQGATQPTYDFLGGGGGGGEGNSPPKKVSRIGIRQGSVPRADIGNEDLRAQVKTLQYELDSYKQEKELTKIRHEKELRDVQAKAETDFKRAQASESSKHVTAHKQENLARELKDLQDRFANTQHDLEKKLRAAQDSNRSLQEEAELAQSELASSERQHSHRLKELERQHGAVQGSLSETRGELDAKAGALQVSQDKLTAREEEVDKLESELLKLKSQGGDTEELAAIQRELMEQVVQMRRLEKTNREQLTELRGLRQAHKAVGIVEEEKRVLELKVQRMDDLERELGEARFQRQVLEDERGAWTAYLRQGEGEAATEFDSPESVARALAEERLERASLAERLGAVQPEIAEKEALVQSLEAERNKLRAELEKAKASSSGGTSSASTSSSSDARAKARVERQKALALKEVEYLREQLRIFEAEDTTATGGIDAAEGQPSAAEEQARQRISELEELLAKYRDELQTANTTLSTLEAAAAAANASSSQQAPSLKRAHPSDEPSVSTAADEPNNARIGALTRKTRTLQTELSSAQNANTLLGTEISSLKSKVASLREASRTRVLNLRSNPTDDYHALKGATIATLREENGALRQQLVGSSKFSGEGKLVPASSLVASQHEIAALKVQVADREKRVLRLKQIWARKALELREAVASLLGWKVEFMPNGKFRLASIFYPNDAKSVTTTTGDGDGEGEGDDERARRRRRRGGGGADDKAHNNDGNNDDENDEPQHYLLFDGEKGTVQISGGGAEGRFGREIKPLLRFWVEERKEIPGLMAACTLEFYERFSNGRK